MSKVSELVRFRFASFFAFHLKLLSKKCRLFCSYGRENGHQSLDATNAVYYLEREEWFIFV